MGSVEALFIDVGGTLLGAKRGAGVQYAEVARRFGVDASDEAIARRFGRAFERERRGARASGGLCYGSTEVSARAFWRRVVDEVFAPFGASVAAIDQIFDELYEQFARASAWEVFADGIELLDAARAVGLPIVVVSNWDARLPALLETTGLRERVDAVVASFAAGAEKPHPDIFDAAVSALKRPVQRSRILHVGDSMEDDFDGARSAGLTGVHLDRCNRYPDDSLRVRSLAELIDWLDYHQ